MPSRWHFRFVLTSIALIIAGLSGGSGPLIASASAPHGYAIQDLGVMPGGPSVPYTSAYLINERGQVAGNGLCCDGAHYNRAFVWQAGEGIRDLGVLPNYQETTALGLGRRGEVVGYASVRLSTVESAFLWQPDSGMLDLGSLGDPQSRAAAINSRGDVVGYSTPRGLPRHAFLWRKGHGMTDLGVLPGTFDSVAFAINDHGQIAGASGSHAVIWQSPTELEDLGTLGGDRSEARFINNRGQVAGTSTTAALGVTHAFLWQRGRGMQDLGNLGGLNLSVHGLNERGDVVGSGATSVGSDHAFVWQPGSGMRDLGTLGGTTSGAGGINNRRQVVGASDTAIPEAPDFNSKPHAFLWDAATGMQDLGTLPNSMHSRASAINDRGQIVGGSGGTLFDFPSHAVMWATH